MDRKRQKLTLEKKDVQRKCQDEKITSLERKLEHMENKLKLVNAELDQVKEGRARDKINFETEKCELESKIDKYKDQCTELQSENERLQKYFQDLESANININESNDDALNINSLPNEIILNVFGYLEQNQLGQIARVCRKWNLLTKSPVLWKNVDVIFFPLHRSQTTVAKSFITGLPSCVASIRLVFSNCRAWAVPLDFAELCLRLQEKCPHLERLILIHSEISSSVCSVIDLCSQFLQDVKNLIFHYSRFYCYCPTGECFGISKIKILELFNCYIDCFSSCKSPFSKMPHLEQLHLYSTRLCDSWFKDDSSFLNQLHVLNVGGRIMTTETFQAIQIHGHNLKELYLCLSFLQDHDLNFNNSAFPHLKTICLYCPYPITCEGIVSLIQSCPSLQNVYVSERVAEFFAVHPFVVANRCKAGIVKAIDWNHNHNVDYSHT